VPPVAHPQPIGGPLPVRADRRRVGVLFHPSPPAAQELAHRLGEVLRVRGAEVTLLSARDEAEIATSLPDLDWAVTLGGDGTFVRTARAAAPCGVPLIGVNFGQLGFLAELEPEEALLRVPELLRGERWLESRLMLRCTARIDGQPVGPLDAVNDVFVGRGRVARAIRLLTVLDGVPLARLSGDGLLIASPTGSTGYSFAAGGPIIAPHMEAMLLTPVMPHPIPVRAMVLPAPTVVEVTVETDEEATLAIDGQIHHPLGNGDFVRVAIGPNRVQVLRLRPPEQFYGTLVERLHRW
jgi:NAD+ kinase